MSISRLEDQLLQELTPIEQKEGYQQMVAIDAVVDWEDMTDGQTNLVVDEETVEYGRSDIASIEYTEDAPYVTVKALSSAYQHLSSHNRNPDIHYRLEDSLGFVTVPEKDVQFTVQKVPTYEGKRLDFALFSDNPSNYANPRSKTQFYSQLQEELRNDMEEIEKELNREGLKDKVWEKLDYVL